jgi:drug/metabolite transporter (DMT)-like permease
MLAPDPPTETDARQDRAARGIFLTVLGIGLITVNDATMKWLTASYPMGEVIFGRGLFALVPIAFLACRAGGFAALRWRSARTQIISALLLAVPVFVFIYSLKQLPLSLATIIFFTNPLFVTALAPFVLAERVEWRRKLAVAIGFIGAVVIIDPGGTEFRWILLGPALVAVLSAVRELYIRTAMARETAVSLLASASVLVTATAACTAGLGGWLPLDAQAVALLAVAGMGFGFGIYCLTEGLRFADASLLSVFKYSAIVWALLLELLLWGQVPTAAVWLGTGLVMASGSYIALREHRLRRTRD